MSADDGMDAFLEDYEGLMMRLRREMETLRTENARLRASEKTWREYAAARGKERDNLLVEKRTLTSAFQWLLERRYAERPNELLAQAIQLAYPLITIQTDAQEVLFKQREGRKCRVPPFAPPSTASSPPR